MRLWHKGMLHYLPTMQLRGQWRECCAIAKNIAEKGSPNHILVNPIMDYPLSHFVRYCHEVAQKLEERGIAVDLHSAFKYIDCDWTYGYFNKAPILFPLSAIFPYWHTDRYFVQCYCNLEEKYDRGAILEEEWIKFRNFAYYICPLCQNVDELDLRRRIGEGGVNRGILYG